MQRLTDAPRQGLTVAQVLHLLVDGATFWTAGAELVTSSGRVDISDDLVGGGVDWSGDQDVHRSCQIGLTRELAWGRDQVALFMVAEDPGSSITVTETVVDRAATTASRTDDTDAEWAQGTLTNVAASANTLVLAGIPGSSYTIAFATTSISASGVGFTVTQKGSLNVAATLTSLAVKFHATGSSTIRPVVYSAAGAKIAEGPQQTITVSSTSTYYSMPFTTGVPLSAGTTYFIGYRDTAGGGVGVGQNNGTTAHTHASSPAYTTWSDAGSGGIWYAAGDAAPNTAAAAELTMRMIVESPGSLATSGTRVSPALSLASLSAVDSSMVSWTAATPAGTSVTVQTSVDGSTWQAATSGGPIAGVTAGGQVQTKVTLTGNGTATPSVSSLTVAASQVEQSHTVSRQAPAVARFYLGVFVLTTPQRQTGETPETFDVEGYDLLHLLQSEIGDTYVAEAGTTYLQAVRDAITASGAGSTVRLDGTLQGTPLPGPMVWCLSDEPVSWLRVVNDLLAAINYRGIWVDEAGSFRSEPYRDPSSRPVEFTFGTGALTILGDSMTETADVWGAPNWWRFVRKDSPTWPVEGAGIYTVQNLDQGASSQASVGRIVRAPVQRLDAADQSSLVAQGDRIVATDRAVTRIIEGKTGPFPAAGHWDVVVLDDPKLGGAVKVQARSWRMPLDGGDVEWVWEAVNA